MEIIMNYIDNMFSGIPVTSETSRLREDITANMTDKYDELVKEGKSGNEAIGTVISEFGNIAACRCGSGCYCTRDRTYDHDLSFGLYFYSSGTSVVYDIRGNNICFRVAVHKGWL